MIPGFNQCQLEDNVFCLGYWLMDSQVGFFHGSPWAYLRFAVWLIYSLVLTMAQIYLTYGFAENIV